MVLSLIGGRLLQLQGVDRSTYAASALDQQLQSLTLTATRGSITDRAGDVLAASVDARDVVADPEQISDPLGVAGQLAPLLNVKALRLYQELSAHSEYALLTRTPVSPSVGDAVLALKLPGITTTDTTRRIYPDGSLGANVIGFVGANGQGAGGLEYSYQRALAGRNGSESYQVGADGQPIPDGETEDTPAVPGSTIRLTLQRDIQYEAQQQIDKQVKITKSLSGTVIVMNPRNGQILALATAPTFNPNHLAKARNSDLGDPAVSVPFEPGSVNKVITMSAALEDGLVTPNSRFVIPNSYDVAGTPFHDAEYHGTEHLTLTGILAKSSNIGAIKVAQRLGPQRFDYYLHAYGFGKPTGVGLPAESAGLLPPRSAWSGTTLATMSFGQGIDVTAMQVASVYSTIANNGVRVTPNIVEGTDDPGHPFVPAPAPARHRVISVKVATELRNMLESVTSDQGTAPAARIKGYWVAGKTGTANRYNGHGGYSGAGYTATFVGMVPADKPQLVCEVVLDRPLHNHYGGAVAAPIFHDVMSFALRTLKIAPTFTKPPRAKLTW
ncbi:MAG TPA: penicillin-binding protein 2 [Mycobacteriales bacterium]|nr:penicillin-binding protein 2 [Mycobacteriales bacterium]